MAGEGEQIWTVRNDPNANISRVSTASAKQRKQIVDQHNNNNNNNNNNNGSSNSGNNNNNNNNCIEANQSTYVGVQSRFQRQYYHKTVVVILALILLLVVTAFCIFIYFGRRADTICTSKNCIRAASNLLQSMDLTANPCNDFYQMTCGNWAEDHPRPDSSNSYDWFTERQTKILRYIRRFLQSNGTSTEPRAVKQTRIMYRACLDTDGMDTLGLQPILDYLQKFKLPKYPSIIDKAIGKDVSAADEFDWIVTAAEIKRITSADSIIGFDIFPEPTDRSRNRMVLGVPETGSILPFKSDYEKKVKILQNKRIKGWASANEPNDIELDDKDDETIGAYTGYMTEVMSAFVFYSDPEANLELVLPAIKEAATKIVKTTKFLLEVGEKAENMSRSDVAFATEDLLNLEIDDFQNATDLLIKPGTYPIWHQYLSTVFQSVEPPFVASGRIILTSRSDMFYLQQLVQYLVETPKIEIELYLWWTIVEEMVLHTTSDIRRLHGDYTRSITSLEGSTSRSLYCTAGVNQLMGMAVSFAIVQPDFLTTSKPKVLTMLAHIRRAFNSLVEDIPWMDDGTKCSTLNKSNAMRSFVGFPEWIIEPGKLDEFYGNVTFNETAHLKNFVDVLASQMLEKLQSLDEKQTIGWATTPTNVNAFHTFQSNTITVPLAILQYPFYELGLEALNYGAIGTILGHELTHGFDNNGRQFDADGNMRQWWTNRTIVEYLNRTQCFINQYNNYYIPEIDEHINGELTLDENIADNGGLREAYYAYKLYVEESGKEELLPGLERYTHEQLLFISYGNLWCETATSIATKWALEDTHCPGRIRLKGVLDNSPEFNSAFNCQPQSRVAASKQCRIW